MSLKIELPVPGNRLVEVFEQRISIPSRRLRGLRKKKCSRQDREGDKEDKFYFEPMYSHSLNSLDQSGEQGQGQRKKTAAELR